MGNINKLFYFHSELPHKEKAKILREAADYIDKYNNKIDYVRVTNGVPFEGIYVINDAEVEANIKKNKTHERKH